MPYCICSDGYHLLAAIKEVLGDAATSEIIEAWAEAYEALAVIFIDLEENIYETREKTIGGYRGYKEFIITKKIPESDVITSFYLKRKDGSPIPQFKPGQYISLTLNIPNTSHKHTRNYSLSDEPKKDYLRISVKKETGTPEGIVSNYLHTYVNEGDCLSLSMPSGEFVLSETQKPVVLIAGGVGITPLMSMYKQITNSSNRNVIFIQCALHSNAAGFKKEIKESIKAKNITYFSIYSTPLIKDILGKDYDFEGYLTLDILNKIEIPVDSEFYFCGPTPFMEHVLTLLNTLKISEDHMHYEFFGPSKTLQQKTASTF